MPKRGHMIDDTTPDRFVAPERQGKALRARQQSAVIKADAHQDAPEGPGGTKEAHPEELGSRAAAAHRASHVLTPLRTLTATAPSGAQITFIKFSESDRELSFYQGNLLEQEAIVMWRAKCKAERPGVEAWQAAAAILRGAGWVVE